MNGNLYFYLKLTYVQLSYIFWDYENSLWNTFVFLDLVPHSFIHWRFFGLSVSLAYYLEPKAHYSHGCYFMNWIDFN